eukprot:COSAG02_NODE_49809_length_324_cov_1.128889_1_plen_78_part_01
MVTTATKIGGNGMAESVDGRTEAALNKTQQVQLQAQVVMATDTTIRTKVFRRTVGLTVGAVPRDIGAATLGETLMMWN